MQRSSETIGALAGALGQGPGRTDQSAKVADGDHPGPVPAGGRQDVSLCSLVGRTGHSSESVSASKK